MIHWLRSALTALVVVAATMSHLGCSAERDPISRVQAGALQKSFFVGPLLRDASDDPEFYMRTTVVDVAAGAGGEGLFTSTDAQPTVRIKWEITEQLLVARLTYELITDTDHKGARRTNDGQVVGAFAILKHFDVKRDYNPATGEELNLVAENDTDRAWYDRAYMRVDWSKNVVTDAYDLDTLSQLGMEAGVTFTPISNTNDPVGPDAPVFDPTRGYFDITHKVLASPRIIHDEEWGDFPACYLTSSWPRESCNPSEITLRQSFLRVEDHDYEPLDFDGKRMELFGYFTDDRMGYDRKYGVVDDKWHRFATRWNIFERSHDDAVACAIPETTPPGADPHRDEDGNGTEDECEKVGRGSRCDAFRGECTIPLRDRKVKTIAWHTNTDFPEEIFDGTRQALTAWSEAIRVGVISGRLAECRRTHQEGCEGEMGWPARWADDFSPKLGAGSPAEVPNVFVLCHNPVDPAKGDDPACGAKGLSPRLGDLRYNLITYILSPQVESPWGIMVDAEDPLTGEKISGSVNQWGGTLDRAAGALVDILGLLNGEIAPDKFIQGKNVDAWLADVRAGATPGAGAMSAAEIASRKGAFDPTVLASRLAGVVGAGKLRRGPPAAQRSSRYRSLVDRGRFGPGNTALSARFAHLRGSAIETQMVTPDLAQAGGFDPTAPLTKDAVDRASPFRSMSPVWRRSHERASRLGMAARHSCKLAGTDPDNLLALAHAAQKLFPPADPNDGAAVAARQQSVFTWARQEYSKSVYAHELGHSMGLRHNFAASFDSLNYLPQYWQLRTKNGTVTSPCPEGNTDGDACVGPRWKDPLTSDELEGNVNRFGTTSVMDYPGDANHDQLLPGKYDRAAMRFGYGGVVDVWNKDGVQVNGSGSGQKEAYRLLGFTQSTGLWGIIDFPPIDPGAPYEHIHYSQYQNAFGLLGDCQPDSGPDAVLGKKCNERAMDVVDYDSMRDFVGDPNYPAYSLYPHAVDASGRVRRGYMFSSDEFSDSGNVPSFTYDAGADAYEQIRFLEQAYEHRYVLDAFRRGRTGFNSYDYMERLQAHYLDAIQQISKAFAFGAILDGDPTQPDASILGDGQYGALAMGSSVAFDLFARILTRPEPGSYCSAEESTCYVVQPDGVAPPLYGADVAPVTGGEYAFTIPLGAGRYVHNDFDYNQGYWWGDYQTQAGAYYEKIWSIYYLAEAFDSFVSNSKEDFTDGRYKNVSFATVYPAQMRRLFSSVLTGDLEQYAPWSTTTGGKTAELEYPNWHDLAPPPARPASAALVDPNFGWNEQLYAMVWGTMFFPTDWSMSFIDDARITTLGADQVSWPANETYAFYDPVTGMTYRAHASGTETTFGKVHQKGIGARQLEWANSLVALAYKVELDDHGEPALNADGSPKLVLDANGHPEADPDYASATSEFAHSSWRAPMPF
jgi:hypothetical protein